MTYVDERQVWLCFNMFIKCYIVDISINLNPLKYFTVCLYDNNTNTSVTVINIILEILTFCY